MTDTIFADVSEFQAPVNDSYPYPVLSIRSNDGTYRDGKFAANYAWMRRNLDSGRLVFGIVYCYCRTNWLDTANTLKDMINRNGGLHPRVALMLDVESGGNPGGDGSDWINRTYWNLADWCGDPKRVIAYANAGDFNSMWRTRPDGLRIIGAGYGRNPNLPGQVAHQYTDGNGYGGGLPEGCPPFGNCDMNSADGLSAQDFAAACGIGEGEDVALSNDDFNRLTKWIADFIIGYVGPIGSDTKDIREQLTGGRDKGQYPGWEQSGHRTLLDLTAAIAAKQGIPGTSDNNPTGTAK